MNANSSGTALVGLIVGGVVALPIYAQLPDLIRIAPTLYFLTLAMCFLGWGLGVVLHAGAQRLLGRWIARGTRG